MIRIRTWHSSHSSSSELNKGQLLKNFQFVGRQRECWACKRGERVLDKSTMGSETRILYASRWISDYRKLPGGTLRWQLLALEIGSGRLSTLWIRIRNRP